MRVKSLFFLLVLLLFFLGGVLLYVFWDSLSANVFLLEGIILFILLYLVVLYRRILKPMDIIGNGMDLLREQDFSSRLSTVGQYESDRLVDIFNRMMDQLKYERLRLREQNHFLDLLINASPMGVVITTLDGELSQLNPMALKIMGVRMDDVLGKRLDQIDSPIAAGLAAIPKDKSRVIRLNDANIYKCSHSTFVDRGFGHPFYLIERMTEEVMLAEKRAYEKVIRMIAHEVNNTTAGITSTLDTLGEALTAEPGMEDVCEVMNVCTERCFSMSRFITRFADVVKIPQPSLAPVRLNDLAQMSKRFMEGMCNDHQVRLRLECDPEVGNVKMDITLMEQVMVNIIKNAAESISGAAADTVPTDGVGESAYRGEIVIRTATPAIIEVADNGPGISKEAEARLFTPFYSSKPNGQGIGLMFIREVLSRHGCSFFLRTGDDGWTRFRILFS